MTKKDYLDVLKGKIENKRTELNFVIENKALKEEILKSSQELDILILEYSQEVNGYRKSSGF